MLSCVIYWPVQDHAVAQVKQVWLPDGRARADDDIRTDLGAQEAVVPIQPKDTQGIYQLKPPVSMYTAWCFLLQRQKFEYNDRRKKIIPIKYSPNTSAHRT